MSAELFDDPAFRAGHTAGSMLQGEPVRVLSLWQPWASLIAIGAKAIETRSWSTRYRGLIAIHAARTTVGLRPIVHGRRSPDDAQAPDVSDVLAERASELPKPLPLGAVVALVRLIDVRSTGTTDDPPTWIYSLSTEEALCGNFSPGRFGWKLELVGKLNAPIPYRASQGLKPAPRSLVIELARDLVPQPKKEPKR